MCRAALISGACAQIANGSNVYVFYSTPACYGYAINEERPAGWEVKEDDFMPYAFINSSHLIPYLRTQIAI